MLAEVLSLSDANARFKLILWPFGRGSLAGMPLRGIRGFRIFRGDFRQSGRGVSPLPGIKEEPGRLFHFVVIEALSCWNDGGCLGETSLPSVYKRASIYGTRKISLSAPIRRWAESIAFLRAVC